MLIVKLRGFLTCICLWLLAFYVAPGILESRLGLGDCGYGVLECICFGFSVIF